MSRPNLPPVETIKQRVRARLAEIAGHSEQAQIPLEQRAPLHQFFSLKPFDSETAKVIGATGAWSTRQLMLQFRHGYESEIEPYYGDIAKQDHTAVFVERERLRVNHAEYQRDVLYLFAQYAAKNQSIYDLVFRLNQEMVQTNLDTDIEVSRVFSRILLLPRPKGKGGIKASKNFRRDLLILDLIRDLLERFSGLPAEPPESQRDNKDNIDACTIVTNVWSAEFDEYEIKDDAGNVIVVPAHRLPANAARNVWTNRRKYDQFNLAPNHP